MEKTVWENLLDSIERLHYTGILWLICSLIALIFGIKNYRKEITYQLLLIYCLSSLIMMNVIYNFILYSINLKDDKSIIYSETTNTVFAIVEISAFLYFFKQILSNKFIKKLVNIFWIIFFTSCILFLIKMIDLDLSKTQIRKNSYIINIFEFLLLLPLCLLYFYQLLTKDQIKPVKLIDSPSFWVVSGLFFYCIVSLPFLFIGSKIYFSSPYLFNLMGSIHYTSISLLLLCIAKAFSCKKTITI